MNFIRIFFFETDAPRSKIAFFSILAGITNVLFLAILNTSAEHASNNTVRLTAVLMFVINMAIFILSQKYVWTTASNVVESLVQTMRMRIFRKIAACDLENIDKIGKAELYTAINQHTYTITVSSLPIIVSLQSIVLVVFSLGYLAYLSLPAFGLALLFIIGAVFSSIGRSKKTNQFLDAAVDSEQHVFYSLIDLLEGFKEIKLNHDREHDLVDAADNLAERAKNRRTAANIEMAINFIGTQTAFYFLMAILVFIIPQLSLNAYPDTIIKIVTAGLFLIGPITSIVSLMPTFSNAELSMSLILKTEALLDQHQEKIKPSTEIFDQFNAITLHNIGYQYIDKLGVPGFSIGPLSFEIRPNEILFITGGNGSGKSTLLNLLLGLYTPNSGIIKLDGTTISPNNVLAYRNLFSAVLSDYHLFSKTYGLSSVDQKQADALVERMGLKGKTALIDNEFNIVNLSSGQKKRLALVIAILEDRPVMVFDEWAADQDPQFRKCFYHEILPELKAKGKTIVAVTHDEKYFDCSDRHLHMEEGLISPLDNPNATSHV